jgi:7-keto-8-aminopelargonate synthetase-like enzyme
MAQQSQQSDCSDGIKNKNNNKNKNDTTFANHWLKRGAEELGVTGLRDILEGRSNCHSLNPQEYRVLPSLLDQIFDMDESKPRNSLEKTLRDRLDRRYVNSTLRKLTTAPKGAVDFSSNDFLSLSTSPALRSAFIDELTKSPDFTLGSGGSRLLDGNSPYALALEEEIAAFHNAPTGLLFNSGFDANAGVFACVPQSGDIIVHDELIHASVHDGMKMSRAAKKIPFPHNSTKQLREILKTLVDDDVMIGKGPKNVFIAVESVYSMDGDIAPLQEIVDLVEEILPYGNGHIIIDEAHGTGVIGPKGRGLVCELGLEDKVFARLHTFGKALASSGGAYSPIPHRIDNDTLKYKPLDLNASFSVPSHHNTYLTLHSNRPHHPPRPLLLNKLRPSPNLHNVHALPLPRLHKSILHPPPKRNHRTPSPPPHPLNATPAHLPPPHALPIIPTAPPFPHLFRGNPLHRPNVSKITYLCFSDPIAKESGSALSGIGFRGESCGASYRAYATGKSLSACWEYDWGV